MNSQDVPIFLQAGVDTVINQLSVLDDDPATPLDERLTADTTAVNVYNYAVSRGDCDGSPTPARRDSSGPTPRRSRRCGTTTASTATASGFRPRARSLYSLNGKLNYTYGTGSRLSLSLAQSRFHGHSAQFPVTYLNTLSTGLLRGFSNRNRLATLSWTQNLSKSAERALALDVALSYQQDRVINSPLTIESDLSTRDPFGGLHHGGHGLRLRLRQLPGDRGADRQHPAQPGPDHTGRREQRQQLPNGRRSPEQRLRALWALTRTSTSRRRHLGDGRVGPVHVDDERRRPGQPVQGRPLHRQGDARLAGRPLQSAQVRRRVHPVQHRLLQLPIW